MSRLAYRKGSTANAAVSKDSMPKAKGTKASPGRAKLAPKTQKAWIKKRIPRKGRSGFVRMNSRPKIEKLCVSLREKPPMVTISSTGISQAVDASHRLNTIPIIFTTRSDFRMVNKTPAIPGRRIHASGALMLPPHQ
jgi:hypothetical protein